MGFVFVPTILLLTFYVLLQEYLVLNLFYLKLHSLRQTVICHDLFKLLRVHIHSFSIWLIMFDIINQILHLHILRRPTLMLLIMESLRHGHIDIFTELVGYILIQILLLALHRESVSQTLYTKRYPIILFNSIICVYAFIIVEFLIEWKIWVDIYLV